MKKILLLIISLAFLSFNCFAKDDDYSYDDIARIAYGPAGLVIVLSVYGASMLSNDYETYKDIQTANAVDFKNYKICDKIKEVYLNADEIPSFYGKEIKGYSHIDKVAEFEPLVEFKKKNSYEPYICIKPEKTKIFENGCLDTLEKDKYKKATGKWYVNRIFKYGNIEYVQLITPLEYGKYKT
ncbi:MAG TPA: hypothetical protein DCL21_01585, partial [Alphaproteobacteria bacterium]|nr:hypothetical protein [Alphaproteobacteria bacterium]